MSAFTGFSGIVLSLFKLVTSANIVISLWGGGKKKLTTNLFREWTLNRMHQKA